MVARPCFAKGILSIERERFPEKFPAGFREARHGCAPGNSRPEPPRPSRSTNRRPVSRERYTRRAWFASQMSVAHERKTAPTPRNTMVALERQSKNRQGAFNGGGAGARLPQALHQRHASRPRYRRPTPHQPVSVAGDGGASLVASSRPSEARAGIVKGRRFNLLRSRITRLARFRDDKKEELSSRNSARSATPSSSRKGGALSGIVADATFTSRSHPSGASGIVRSRTRLRLSGMTKRGASSAPPHCSASAKSKRRA